MNKQELRHLLERAEEDNPPYITESQTLTNEEMSTAYADYLTEQGFMDF